jgi:hypothetical protein
LSKGKKFVAITLLTFIALIVAGAMWGHHGADPTGPAFNGLGNFNNAKPDVPLSQVGINNLANQTAHVGVSVNVTWMLMCGFLVLFMQVGFAFLVTGLTRAKNAAHMMMMNIAAFAVAFLAYYLVGFAFQFGGVGALANIGGTTPLDGIFGHGSAGVIGLQAAAIMEVPNEPIAALLARHEVRPGSWIDLAAASGAPLFGTSSWFDLLLANGGGIPPGEKRSARLVLLSAVPARLVADVVRFMGERKITLSGAEARTLISGWRGRSLLFVAPRDNWIHPEVALPLLGWLDPRSTQARTLSPIEGAGTDYGHLGMLLGPDAERDVWSPILDFVNEVGR